MVPEKIPKPKAARINDKNGCHLRTEVVIIIKTMDKSNKRINHITQARYLKKINDKISGA